MSNAPHVAEYSPCRTGSRQIDSEGAESLPPGGDIIVGLDGVAVQSMDDLIIQLAGKAVGQTVTLTVVRSGEELGIEVTLEERPEG